MPGRHSPPVAAEERTAEKLKKPSKERSVRRPQPHKARIAHKYLHQAEALSPSPSQAPSKAAKAANPPETLNAPALALPKDLPSTSTVSNTGKKHAVPASEPIHGNEGGIIVIDGVEFHHGSEAEFARLLTYYGIDWQYEPNQFPLQWRDSRPIEMFTPDFYLPEYDLYIELTTMRQSLVRRKNRKLRLLRALYPEINIKLLYRRDYHRLLERFGIRPDEMEAEQPPGERQ